MAYKFRNTKQTVRNLSREYGKVGAVYRPVANDHDILTGEVKRDYDIHIIKRIIPMPFKVARNFITDAAYDRIENHIQGAYYTTDERTLIIELKYLDIELDEEDHIVIDEARYEITKIVQVEDMSSVMVDVRALVSVDPYSKMMMAYINAGWNYQKQKSAFAVDELILGIRFDVFAGTIPVGFDCLPIVGKNFSDALITLFGHVSVTPTTATASDYKEYGINGGIDDANIETDAGFTPSYEYADGTVISFLAGNVVLTVPQEIALNSVVQAFNARLGRKP